MALNFFPAGSIVLTRESHLLLLMSVTVTSISIFESNTTHGIQRAGDTTSIYMTMHGHNDFT